MTEKKKVHICRYIDKDDSSSLIMISNKAGLCYDRCIKIDSITDYYNIDVDDMMKKRAELIKKLHNDEIEECKTCPLYYEKEIGENDFPDKISWLNIASFETCTLKCRYCYFTPEQLGAPLEEEKRYLFPIIKQFHDKNVLADNVCIAIAGGEPGLFKDLPETLEFMKNNYKSPRFNFQSNATCTATIKKMVPVLKECKNFTFKNLYTSIDAGTPETFEKVRGLNLFDSVIKNVKYMAESGAFTHMQLKYIVINNPEYSNFNNKDILGFCKIVGEVKELVKDTNLSVAIDFDLKRQFEEKPKELINAAAKIVRYCMKNNIDYVISNCNFCTDEERRVIENIAKKSLALKFIVFKRKFSKAVKLYKFFQQ